MLKGYLEKFTQQSESLPTKPTKPTFEGFVGTRENHSETILTPDVGYRSPLGAMTRPIPVFADHKLDHCLFDACPGRLSARGSLWLCENCGTWFSWAGRLSEDDRREIERAASLEELNSGADRLQAETAAAEKWEREQWKN